MHETSWAGETWITAAKQIKTKSEKQKLIPLGISKFDLTTYSKTSILMLNLNIYLSI